MDDEDNEMYREGTTEDGSGKNRHNHPYKVGEDGSGNTTGTDGDGPEHEHEIVEKKVQKGGEDNHTHPDIACG
jgi:hypothetical protein